MKNQSVSDFVAATMDAVLNSQEHKSLFGSQYKTAQTMADKACAKCGSKHGDKDSCMADDNDARKAKKKPEASEESDSSNADDNDARKKKRPAKEESDEESSDSSSADDKHSHFGGGMLPGDRDKGEYDSHFADDNDAKKKKKPAKEESDEESDEESSDSSSADDNDVDSSQSNPYPSQYDADEYRPGDVLRADDELAPSVAFDVAIDSLLTASAALDSVGLGRGSALTLKIASLVVEAKKKDKKDKKDKKSKKPEAKKSDSKKTEKKDTMSAKDKSSPKKDKSSPKEKSSPKKDDKKKSSK